MAKNRNLKQRAIRLRRGGETLTSRLNDTRLKNVILELINLMRRDLNYG